MSQIVKVTYDFLSKFNCLQVKIVKHTTCNTYNKR